MNVERKRRNGKGEAHKPQHNEIERERVNQMESIGKKCKSNSERIERRIRETYQQKSDRKWGWKKR